LALIGAENLLNPLVSLWNGFVNIIPGLVAAVIILIIGYLIAFIIGHAVKLVLQKFGLDKRLAKAKISKAIGYTHMSSVLGEITKWYIFVIFIQAAVDVLNLGTLSILLNEFAMWLPNLIAAVIIVLFGLILSHYVVMKLEEHSKVRGIRTLGKGLKAVMIFIIAMIALEQIGIDISILKNGFLLLIAGVALAIGLAFGYGARKQAGDAIKKIKRIL